MTEEQRELRRSYYREMWNKKYKFKYLKNKDDGRDEVKESNRKNLIQDVIFLSNEKNGGGIEVVDKSETPDRQIETDEIYRIIWEAVKTLDPISREIATLILGSVKDENIANSIPCDIEAVKDVRLFLMNVVGKMGLEE